MKDFRKLAEKMLESIIALSFVIHSNLAEQEDWRHHPIYYNTKNGVPIPLLHQEENLSNNGLIISYGRAPCSCDAWDCSCCTDLIYDVIKFKERGCFQFGYSLKQEKIRVKLLMNDTKIVEDDVTDEEPTPFCLPSPSPPSLSTLEMCAKVSNLSFPGPGRNIQFCLNFETRHSNNILILKFDCARFGDNGFHSFDPHEPENLVTALKPLVTALPTGSTTSTTTPPPEEDFDLDLAFDRFMKHNDSTLTHRQKPGTQPSKTGFLPTALPNRGAPEEEVSPTNFVLAAKPSGFVLPGGKDSAIPPSITQPPPSISIANFIQPSKMNLLQPLTEDQSYEGSAKVSTYEHPPMNFSSSMPESSFSSSGPSSDFSSSDDETNYTMVDIGDHNRRPPPQFDDSFMEFELFDNINGTTTDANGTQINVKPVDAEIMASFSDAMKTFNTPNNGEGAGATTTEGSDFGELEEVFMGTDDMDSDETPQDTAQSNKDFQTVPYSPQFIDSFSQSPPSSTERQTYIQRIPFRKTSHR